MGKPPKIIPSRSFYDLVAENYNSHMNSEASDRIRAAVKSTFDSHVAPNSIVLDFGGGTGLDLHWLREKYKVIFLEPSENMRSEAKYLAKAQDNITFITANTDFSNWSQSDLPFSSKADGIVMNFAVLNCIKEIELLFEKLSLVCKPGSLLVATIIKPSSHILFKDQPMKLVLRNLLKKKGLIYQNYRGSGHETYIYRVATIQSAAKKYFDLVSYTELEDTNFGLLILSAR